MHLLPTERLAMHTGARSRERQGELRVSRTVTFTTFWRTRSVCALLTPKAHFKLARLPLGSTRGSLTRAGFISRVSANVAIPLRRTSPTPAGRGTRHKQSACAYSAQTCCARREFKECTASTARACGQREHARHVSERSSTCKLRKQHHCRLRSQAPASCASSITADCGKRVLIADFSTVARL